jgi:non-ribosomal peptide synthetase component F
MDAANIFWLDTLHDYNLDQPLSLPFDRYRLSNEHRTDRGTSVSFDFDPDLSQHFLAYASSKNIKPEYLSLAIYYVFLFKLTNGSKDLCVGMNTANRYKDELESVIGLFENVIPLRCQLDPHWSFHQLEAYVCEIMTSSLEYSYFPFQRILNQHKHKSKPAFLNISINFQSNTNDKNNDEVMIGDSQLSAMPISIKINKDQIMNTSDFALTIQHDINMNQLSCTINASLDVFNAMTTQKITQRFHSLLNHLFTPTNNDQMNKSIYELSLILPDERLLMQSMNNTEISVPSASCIHHEFVYQVMKHPQKLAVELDDQSLTYCELLYYVQLLSINLLNDLKIKSGDIICQCVERSISMVS